MACLIIKAMQTLQAEMTSHIDKFLSLLLQITSFICPNTHLRREFLSRIAKDKSR